MIHVGETSLAAILHTSLAADGQGAPHDVCGSKVHMHNTSLYDLRNSVYDRGLGQPVGDYSTACNHRRETPDRH